jgi:GNAT superfamily N-acetyltransferase
MEVVVDPGAAEFATAAWSHLQGEPLLNMVLCSLTQIRRRAELAGTPVSTPMRWLRVVADGAVVGAGLVDGQLWSGQLSVMPTAAAVALAEHVAGWEPPLSAVSGPVAVAGAFAEAYFRRSGTTARPGMAMQVFRLDAVSHPAGVPGRMRAAVDSEAELIHRWVTAFRAEALPDEAAGNPTEMIRRRLAEGGTLWFWEVDGEPVSFVLRSVLRPDELPGLALAGISGVYTPPEQRGHGYASANVAALSQLSLDEGCAATALMTDLANPTSNKIYQAIGYRPVGAAQTWLFGGA